MRLSVLLGGVDVVRAYSKRWDLVDDLDRARRQLQKIGTGNEGEHLSVRSIGRQGGPARVRDRLGEAALAELIGRRRAGATIPPTGRAVRHQPEQYQAGTSAVRYVIEALGYEYGIGA
jgi:hypothetical protein